MGRRKSNKPPQNAKKRKQDTDESDESSDSEQTTQQSTSPPTLNVPRFLIVTSEEKDRKVSDLSPFVIEKCINSIAGHPKSIKRLKSGDLLLEVEKKSHVENLLATKKLFDLNVKISLHNTLNSCKGVIRCQDFAPCTDDEILQNLKSEGVTDVRNIQVRRNGVVRRTYTYVLTFNTPILPKKIKAAYLSVNVEVYIPNPLRCYKCQVFGYHEDHCLKKAICANCGGDKHRSDDRNCTETAKCANCNGSHPVFSRECTTWKKEKEILTVKYKRSVTFFEARKIVEEQLSAPGESYASITKSAGVPVKCTDAQTQTDESYDVQIESTSKASGGNPPPERAQNAGVVPPASQTNSRSKPPTEKKLQKPVTAPDRVPKGSGDPIKQHNRFGTLMGDGAMDTDEGPSRTDSRVSRPRSPVKAPDK